MFRLCLTRTLKDLDIESLNLALHRRDRVLVVILLLRDAFGICHCTRVERRDGFVAVQIPALDLAIWLSFPLHCCRHTRFSMHERHLASAA